MTMQRTAADDIPGYEVLRILGAGGFGRVLLVQRDGVQRAAKVARIDVPGAGERLRVEAGALRVVGAPWTPQLFEEGVLSDGSPYFIMELIDAPTLASVLASRAPLAAVDAVALVAPILDALDAVHRAALIHRDLKPANIFPVSADRAVLVDFGLVKTVVVSPDSGMTAPNVTLGTPAYMAPEQFLDGHPTDVRTDLYAVGLLLFEMIAGRTPFVGHVAEIREGHVARRPPRLSQLAEVPPRLEEIVLRCLDKQPDARFQSAGELKQALAGAMHGDVVSPALLERRTLAPTKATSPAARRLPILLFRSSLELDRVLLWIAEVNAHLIHCEADRFVVVFDHAAAEPQRALGLATAAARSGLRSQVTSSVVMDLADVTVRARPGSPSRYVCHALVRRLRAGEPASGGAGIELSESAARALDAAGLRADVEAQHAGPSDAEPARSPGQGSELPLIGREDLLDQILATLKGALQGDGPALVILTGDAGYGKSRLAVAITDELAAVAAPTILRISPRDAGIGSLGTTLPELLRRALDLKDDEAPTAGRARFVERIGDINDPAMHAAAELALGWSTPDDPEIRSVSAAPGALRGAGARAAVAALRRLSADGPVVLLVDDAHRADDATLDAVEQASQDPLCSRLAVVVLGRPALDSARTQLGERAHACVRVRMEPMSPAQAASLCRAVLGVDDVPEDAVNRLIDRTGGVPYLVIELARALRRQGGVRTYSGGRASSFAIEAVERVPDTPLVDWLAAQELSSLPQALAAHARLIALLGIEVDRADVVGVLDAIGKLGYNDDYPLDAAVGLQRLVASGLLLDDGGNHFRFRHGLVRDGIERATPAAARELVYRAAHAYYRDAAGMDPWRRLERLAHYAAHAGKTSEAADANLRLGEQARLRHRYVEAELYFARALDLLADGDGRRQAAHRGRALVRYRLGQFEASIDDFERARASLPEQAAPTDVATLLLDQAEALDWKRDYARSRELARRARELVTASRIDDSLLESRLLLAEGRSQHRDRQERVATELLERAVAAAEPLGDEAYETRVIALSMLGFIYQELGELSRAVTTLDAAVTLAESHGDRLHLRAALSHRSLIHPYFGDKNGMLADAERTLALGRELGHAQTDLVVNYNVAETLYLMGEIDEARPYVERALAAGRRLFGGDGLPVVWLLVARLAAYSGERGRARELVARIDSMLTAAAAEGRTDLELGPVEQVLLEVVKLDLEDAVNEAPWARVVARAEEIIPAYERLEVLEVCARAFRRTGRDDVASRYAGMLEQRASEIPHVMHRRLAPTLAHTP